MENSTTYHRPSWDEYFLDVADTVAKRATCDRGRSGCVIARGKQILVTGYVGSPTGLPHCDDVGHQMKKTIHEDGNVTNHCVRTVHAEQNAICQAAKLGIPLEGTTLYCRMTPCRTCAMLRNPAPTLKYYFSLGPLYSPLRKLVRDLLRLLLVLFQLLQYEFFRLFPQK